MMNLNKSDIIFTQPDKMDMYLSVQLHDHITSSVYLALLIGLTVGVMIGMNAGLITEILRNRFMKN